MKEVGKSSRSRLKKQKIKDTKKKSATKKKIFGSLFFLLCRKKILPWQEGECTGTFLGTRCGRLSLQSAHPYYACSFCVFFVVKRTCFLGRVVNTLRTLVKGMTGSCLSVLSFPTFSHPIIAHRSLHDVICLIFKVLVLFPSSFALFFRFILFLSSSSFHHIFSTFTPFLYIFSMTTLHNPFISMLPSCPSFPSSPSLSC